MVAYHIKVFSSGRESEVELFTRFTVNIKWTFGVSSVHESGKSVLINIDKSNLLRNSALSFA